MKFVRHLGDFRIIDRGTMSSLNGVDRSIDPSSAEDLEWLRQNNLAIYEDIAEMNDGGPFVLTPCEEVFVTPTLVRNFTVTPAPAVASWDEVSPSSPEEKLTIIGRIVVSESEFERRIAVCQSCDRLSQPMSRCLECGCFMAVKARLRTTDCPLMKW